MLTFRDIQNIFVKTNNCYIVTKISLILCENIYWSYGKIKFLQTLTFRQKLLQVLCSSQHFQMNSLISVEQLEKNLL